MNEATTLTKQDRARQFFEWARGYAALRMAYFGLRLGLLEALRSAPAGLTAPELASALGLDPRYVAAWAKAAYACELLSYDPATERFRLAPHMADLLLNESDPYYLAGIPLSLAVESRQVDRLLESFRTGGGIPFGDYGPDIVESLEALSRAAYEVYLPNGTITFAVWNDLTFSGPVNGTGGTMTINVPTAVTVEFAGGLGESFGSTALTKAGVGTLVLSAAATYSGTTTVSAGALVL
ncbi:MAG: autotransporter-associated beta strand repeat-containing protein, partial [Chloroflexi bacterium]|nr:autotransporter-associated beta strand repeat-containing protein [Chloroflexota bacterium]